MIGPNNNPISGVSAKIATAFPCLLGSKTSDITPNATIMDELIAIRKVVRATIKIATNFAKLPRSEATNPIESIMRRIIFLPNLSDRGPHKNGAIPAAKFGIDSVNAVSVSVAFSDVCTTLSAGK
mmetsp:Transcript_11117/g.12232  ORF Transcript_11117/g.12232 Transcript_11117/m.12232 type:complete len:125 (-) Transcript_11117:232-606(-)